MSQTQFLWRICLLPSSVLSPATRGNIFCRSEGKSLLSLLSSRMTRLRGETFLLCAEQISASCKRCVEQMEIQQQALLAAVGNLQDHYKSTQLAYETSRVRLTVSLSAALSSSPSLFSFLSLSLPLSLVVRASFRINKFVTNLY
jgi:hypothetical protein